MSEENKITLTEYSCDDRLPVLGRIVLCQDKAGHHYVAMRRESTVNKNSYFWFLVFQGKPIGIVLDVVRWYE